MFFSWINEYSLPRYFLDLIPIPCENHFVTKISTCQFCTVRLSPHILLYKCKCRNTWRTRQGNLAQGYRHFQGLKTDSCNFINRICADFNLYSDLTWPDANFQSYSQDRMILFYHRNITLVLMEHFDLVKSVDLNLFPNLTLTWWKEFMLTYHTRNTQLGHVCNQ